MNRMMVVVEKLVWFTWFWLWEIRQKITCNQELPDELNYSYYDVDARGKMRIVNHMHIGTLLYDELRDYIYKLHHCLVITDIILRLGYDVSPGIDDTIYDSIHISFLTFMQNEVWLLEKSEFCYK